MQSTCQYRSTLPAQSLRSLPQQSSDIGVLSVIYTYDANANVASITDALGGTTSRSMGYDNLDRLKTVSARGMWGSSLALESQCWQFLLTAIDASIIHH